MTAYGEAIKQIDAGDIRPVYLLYGDEDYLIDRFAHRLAEAWLGAQAEGYGSSREDGKAITEEKVAELAGQISFLSPRKLLIVDEPAFIPCGKEKMGGSSEGQGDTGDGASDEAPDREAEAAAERLAGGGEDRGGVHAATEAAGGIGPRGAGRSGAGQEAAGAQGAYKASASKNAAGKSGGKAMLGYLEQPDFITCIVLRCRKGKPDRRNKLVAGIAAKGGLIEAAALAPRERIPYLREALLASGKQCAAGVLEQIARQPGGLHACLRELEKLVAYAGGESIITADMAKKVLTPSLESNIFHLVDALGQRRKNVALLELRALLENGESPFAVFAMMLRQFRLIFRAKACLQAGMGKKRIAESLGVRPFVADNAASQSRYYTFTELEGAMALFCEKDLAMKSSIPGGQALADLIIALGGEQYEEAGGGNL